jgi:hypothetical protein
MIIKKMIVAMWNYVGPQFTFGGNSIPVSLWLKQYFDSTVLVYFPQDPDQCLVNWVFLLKKQRCFIF